MTTIESTTSAGRAHPDAQPARQAQRLQRRHAWPSCARPWRPAAVDHGVKAVVLTGAGRAFSSGQDLTEDLPRDGEGRVDLGPPLERDYNPLVLALATYPKPTIAALNGPAVGAAMNIALACDIVLAARSAMLQEAFARIALMPDAGGTWLLPRLVGPKRALALMMTAEPVPAEGAAPRPGPQAVRRRRLCRRGGGLRRGPGARPRLRLPADQGGGAGERHQRPRHPARGRGTAAEAGRLLPRLRRGRRRLPREAAATLRGAVRPGAKRVFDASVRVLAVRPLARRFRPAAAGPGRSARRTAPRRWRIRPAPPAARSPRGRAAPAGTGCRRPCAA